MRKVSARHRACDRHVTWHWKTVGAVEVLNGMQVLFAHWNFQPIIFVIANDRTLCVEVWMVSSSRNKDRVEKEVFVAAIVRESCTSTDREIW